MTFAFPILLGGLALLAIPVLIHLILRQKPRVLKFPAFRFLVKRHKTNLRKLQLRHLLLLALRMFLLALICLALARPKVSGDLLNLQTDRPVAAIFLFDTSYSMQYKTTGDRARLEEARERAIKLLETLHPESRVAVLDTAEAAGSSKAEWHKRDKAIAHIAALTLRYDSAPVTTRLEDAYQLFAKLALANDDEIGRRLPRFLCVFSDRMQACWETPQVTYLQGLADGIPPPLERLQAIQGGIAARIQLLKELREKLPPAPAQDYPEQALIAHWQDLQQKIPSANWDNYPASDWLKLLAQTRGRSRDLLKILHAQDARELSEAAKEYRQKLIDALEGGLRELQGVYAVFVDVGVEEPVDLALLSLELPGGREQRQVFSQKEKITLQTVVQATGGDFETSLVCELDGKEYRRLPVVVKSGDSKTLLFEIDGEALEPGPHQVQAFLSGADQLAFTNHRFATFLIRPPRQILIVSDIPETVQLWKKAIELNEKVKFTCWVKTPEQAQQLKPKELSQYQAVYLINVNKPAPALWEALKNYAEYGGNLGVIPGGDKTDMASYNDDKAAQALLPGKLVRPVEAKEPGAVWDWDNPAIFQHPLFRQFGEWKALQRDDFIKVPRRAFRYWEVEPGAKEVVLVSYADDRKHPAVLERDLGKGKGRVVLLTTRLDTHSNPIWNNYQIFDNSWVVVLPGELTIYLAGDMEKAHLNFLTGQGVPTVALPAGNLEEAFTLKGPGAPEAVFRASKSNELLLRKAVTPGNYQVEDKDGPVGAFSVNLPAEEGLLKRVPVSDIESLFGKEAVRTLQQGDDLAEVMQGYWSTPEELFPFLMLALLVVLALENLLSNLFYRREPRPQEGS